MHRWKAPSNKSPISKKEIGSRPLAILVGNLDFEFKKIN
jgi:hypothetical protein